MADSYVNWELIKAARAAQNDGVNRWAEPCGACRHELREHEFSLELPQRCNHSSEQYNPYERATVKVVCTCREFQPTT